MRDLIFARDNGNADLLVKINEKKSTRQCLNLAHRSRISKQNSYNINFENNRLVNKQQMIHKVNIF